MTANRNEQSLELATNRLDENRRRTMQTKKQQVSHQQTNKMISERRSEAQATKMGQKMIITTNLVSPASSSKTPVNLSNRFTFIACLLFASLGAQQASSWRLFETPDSRAMQAALFSFSQQPNPQVAPIQSNGNNQMLYALTSATGNANSNANMNIQPSLPLPAAFQAPQAQPIAEPVAKSSQSPAMSLLSEAANQLLQSAASTVQDQLSINSRSSIDSNNNNKLSEARDASTTQQQQAEPAPGSVADHPEAPSATPSLVGKILEAALPAASSAGSSSTNSSSTAGALGESRQSFVQILKPRKQSHDSKPTNAAAAEQQIINQHFKLTHLPNSVSSSHQRLVASKQRDHKISGDGATSVPEESPFYSMFGNLKQGISSRSSIVKAISDNKLARTLSSVSKSVSGNKYAAGAAIIAALGLTMSKLLLPYLFSSGSGYSKLAIDPMMGSSSYLSGASIAPPIGYSALSPDRSFLYSPTSQADPMYPVSRSQQQQPQHYQPYESSSPTFAAEPMGYLMAESSQQQPQQQSFYPTSVYPPLGQASAGDAQLYLTYRPTAASKSQQQQYSPVSSATKPSRPVGESASGHYSSFYEQDPVSGASLSLSAPEMSAASNQYDLVVPSNSANGAGYSQQQQVLAPVKASSTGRRSGTVALKMDEAKSRLYQQILMQQLQAAAQNQQLQQQQEELQYAPFVPMSQASLSQQSALTATQSPSSAAATAIAGRSKASRSGDSTAPQATTNRVAGQQGQRKTDQQRPAAYLYMKPKTNEQLTPLHVDDGSLTQQQPQPQQRPWRSMDSGSSAALSPSPGSKQTNEQDTSSENGDNKQIDQQQQQKSQKQQRQIVSSSAAAAEVASESQVMLQRLSRTPMLAKAAGEGQQWRQSVKVSQQRPSGSEQAAARLTFASDYELSEPLAATSAGHLQLAAASSASSASPSSSSSSPLEATGEQRRLSSGNRELAEQRQEQAITVITAPTSGHQEGGFLVADESSKANLIQLNGNNNNNMDRLDVHSAANNAIKLIEVSSINGDPALASSQQNQANKLVAYKYNNDNLADKQQEPLRGRPNEDSNANGDGSSNNSATGDEETQRDAKEKSPGEQDGE